MSKMFLVGKTVYLEARKTKAYHIIPEYRMPGLESFSKWKERLPDSDDLSSFERTLAKEVGERIARNIVSGPRGLLNDEGEKFPWHSVRVEIGDTVLHLPPRISRLIDDKINMFRDCKESKDLIEALIDGLGNHNPVTIIRLLNDICMGSWRGQSISCCYSPRALAQWMDVLRGYDPEGKVRVLQLYNEEPIAVAASEVISESVNRLMQLVFDQTNPEERINLVNAIFNQKLQGSPQIGSVLDALNEYGCAYNDQGRFSNEPEGLMFLGTRAKGFFLQDEELAALLATGKSRI